MSPAEAIRRMDTAAVEWEDADAENYYQLKRD